MSEFSGKCDLYDTLIDIRNTTDWSKVYISQNHTRLPINSQRDLVPYYPYIIGSAAYYDGEARINISKESYVDQEERDHLEYLLQNILKEYRRCKRKKIEFVPTEVAEKYKGFYSYGTYLEIANRVKENPKKPNLEGIHTAVAQMYRKALYDEMLKWGYDEEYTRKWIYSN